MTTTAWEALWWGVATIGMGLVLLGVALIRMGR